MKELDVNEKIPFSFVSKSILQKSIPLEKITSKLKSSIITEPFEFHYFNYGRNALEFLFKELNLKGKKILFPAFVCPSLAYSAISAGCEVAFADVNLDDFNIDITSLKKNLSNSSAVLGVHTFGAPFDVQEVLKLKQKNKFLLIEDCAHSLFAKYNGKYTGNFGDFVLLSMYKQIPNLPGAVLLSKNKLKQENLQKGFSYPVDLLRNSSGPHQFLFNLIRSGKNLPIENSKSFKIKTSLPGSVSRYLFLEFFEGLGYIVKRRRTVVKSYYSKLEKSKYLIPQKLKNYSEPSWFNFSARLRPEFSNLRDNLLLELRKKKIFLDRQWYKPPILFKEFKADEKNYPNTTLLAKTIVNLPIRSNYSTVEIDYLFDSIEKAMNKLT